MRMRYKVCVVEKRLCGQPRQLRAFVRLVLISSVFKQQVKYGTLPWSSGCSFEIEMDSKMKKKKMKKRRMTVAGTKTHQEGEMEKHDVPQIQLPL
ncbi:hypothetical protein KQX54_014915 [Cotesia glomerata]|uniref:Uncharacterized protein n=1 Tax=Cotesia glomerata TaxID=32391 RepID=A0AAV7IKH5_COTGL|nr:hypothetical protein KQX54_014915 [Cotesia glomerata]